jgi:hypothetical protein
MRLLLAISLTLFLTTGAVAQKTKKGNRKFIYGTLEGLDSYTGYFWFDNVLTQMGQRIIYKTDLVEKKGKTLYAAKFHSFTSDSLHLRTFPTMQHGFGRIEAMIPRIVSGRLELYSGHWANYYSFNESDHYYVFTGSQNIRLIRRKFKEQMKELLQDDEDIIQRVDREEVTYDDMPTIIYNYNRRRK